MDTLRIHTAVHKVVFSLAWHLGLKDIALSDGEGRGAVDSGQPSLASSPATYLLLDLKPDLGSIRFGPVHFVSAGTCVFSQ